MFSDKIRVRHTQFGPFPLFNVTFGLKTLQALLYYPQILLKDRTSLFKSKSEVTLKSKLSVKNLLKLFDSKFWLSSWIHKMYSHRLLFIHYIFVWVVFFSDFKLWWEVLLYIFSYYSYCWVLLSLNTYIPGI